MFAILKNYIRRKRSRKVFLEFYKDIKKNLESCYVIRQQGIMRTFRLENWPKAIEYPEIYRQERILKCMTSLEEINRAQRDIAEYEAWYSADINRQTKDNALILHDRKESLKGMFENLDKKIIDAQKDLEAVLRTERILRECFKI